MKIVVIGGGIAGLMAGLGAKQANPLAQITVLERSPQMGGLLAGVDYYDHGLYFDLGTHIFQETGNAEYDSALLEGVPAQDLLHFSVGQGDLSGSVFDGHLQEGTHFPDIRRHSGAASLISSVRKHISGLRKVSELDRGASLLKAAADKFGRNYAEKVLGPLLEHVYCTPADKLSGFAMLLPGLTRVVADDHEDWLLRAVSDSPYRAVVAVPDQRRLPAAMRHTRRSFYSRSRGSRGIVEGVTQQLSTVGASLVTDVHIERLDLQGSRINYHVAGQAHTLRYDRLVIATGVIGAAHLLKLDLSDFKFDRPMPHWLIHLRLAESCPSDLCYLYGLDSTCEWYRVTNYRAFSGDDKDRRLTVEVLGREGIDNEVWPRKVAEHLAALGLLKSPAYDFSAVMRLPAGFPSPTRSNIVSLVNLGIKAAEALPPNAVLCGVGANGGLFFQNEVAPDAYWRAYRMAAI
jgi:protoporphyrinogen oxidase